MTLRTLTVALLTTLPMVWACGGGEVEETGEPQVAQVEEEPDTTPPPVVSAAATTVSRPEVFPHGPHQGVDCLSCHTLLPTHRTHADVACTQCHAIPARFQSLRPLAPSECMNCHHVQQRTYRCQDCHTAGEIAGPKTVDTPMLVDSWAAPRTRTLSFDHVRHTSRACLDCHAAAAVPALKVDCRSCHESHHQLTSTCRSCHVAADPAVHAEAAHRGCAGSGCHVSPTIAAFPPVHQVCRMCHTVPDDHHPGEECADCHVFGGWGRGPETAEAQP